MLDQDGKLQLPPTIECNGSYDGMVAATYAVYEADFISRRLQREGMPVSRDQRVLPDGDGKEEAYWHLTQRENKQTGNREPDFCRASRLSWTRPLIECPPCEEITAFDYDTGSGSKGGVKTFLWLRAEDFVVILKRQPRRFVLLTSFCITIEWLRKDFERKYAHRIK